MLVTQSMLDYLMVNLEAEQSWDNLEQKLGHDQDCFNYVTDKMLAIDRRNTKNKYCSMFGECPEWYECLMFLHHKKYLYKALDNYANICKEPVFIEIIGTPKAGKTSCVKVVGEFLKSAGFNVAIVNDIFKANDGFSQMRESLSMGEYFSFISKLSFDQLAQYMHADVVLIDSGMNDRQVWNYICWESQGFSDFEYQAIKSKFQTLSKNLNQTIFVLKAIPENSIERAHISSLQLEIESFTSKRDIFLYNNALEKVSNVLRNSVATPCATHYFELNTDDIPLMRVCMIIANRVLDSMICWQ